MATVLRIFICYARADAAEVAALREHLDPRLRAAKGFEVVLWQDDELPVGLDWEEALQCEMRRAHAILPLVSSALLVSSFVQRTELPHFQEEGKVLLPLLLKPVDFARSNLRQLEGIQIFRGGPGRDKAFTEMSREGFAQQAFGAIYDRLKKEFPDA